MKKLFAFIALLLVSTGASAGWYAYAQSFSGWGEGYHTNNLFEAQRIALYYCEMYSNPYHTCSVTFYEWR